MATTTEMAGQGTKVGRDARGPTGAAGPTIVAALLPGVAGSHTDVLETGDTRLISAPPRSLPSARDSVVALAGTLLDSATGRPIPYGTITVLGTDVARFTDANGQFRLARLAPGAYRLRARQIGYVPAELAVKLDPESSVTTVTFYMHRIPIRLAAIRVNGKRSRDCVATGVPDSLSNPQLARVFAQVRENVDRYVLLLDNYPFRYSREQHRLIELDPGGDSTESIDTLEYDSRAHRPYRPGSVIYEDSASFGETRRYMYLPTFRDLADSTFLDAHCFSDQLVKGDRKGAPARIRIDFQPASKLDGPDVSGWVELDADSFVVRRAMFRMTKPKLAQPPVLGLSVVTTFREVVPLVPVFDSVESTQPLPDTVVAAADRIPSTGFGAPGGNGGVVTSSSASITATRAAIVRDRLLAVHFERGEPGAEAPVRKDSGVTTVDTPVPTTTDSGGTTLRGKVIGNAGAPVVGASVGLFESARTVTTGPSGEFTYDGAQPGAHVLWVQAKGYASQRDVVVAPSRSPVLATLTRLTTPPVPLPARVRAAYREVGFYQRMRLGGGAFTTIDQLQTTHAQRLTDFLADAHVISTDGPGGVSASNKCTSFVLDGQPVSDPGNIDMLVRPPDIAGIEAYRSRLNPAVLENILHFDPSASAKAIETCGLVVIWTRARLGLPAARSVADDDVSRGFPASSGLVLCELPPSGDTVAVLLYGFVSTPRPRGVPRQSWTQYTGGFVDALRLHFVLPSQLPLAAFSAGFVPNVFQDSSQVMHSDDRTALSKSVSVPSAAARTPRPGELLGAVDGVLLERNTDVPIPSASVVATDAGANNVTDANGHFRMAHVVAGTYQVQVRKVGYVPIDTVVSVRAGPAPTTDTLRLSRIPPRLAAVSVKGSSNALFTAPALSTVISVTLDAAGHLTATRVLASSLSGPADTAVLASVTAAAAANDLPTLAPHGDKPHELTLDVSVTTMQPDADANALVVGRLDMPVWHLRRQAQLADGVTQPDLAPDLSAGDPGADTATVQFVVDQSGNPVRRSAWISNRTLRPTADYSDRLDQHILDVLPRFRFTSAIVSACPVDQLIDERFGYDVGRR